MALPVTITSLDATSATMQVCGGFKSSAGNFYAIGRTAGTTTQLTVVKATDPADTWSVVATLDAVSPAIFSRISCFQVSDTLHIATTETATNVRYHVFSFSSDSFTISNELASTVAVNDQNFRDLGIVVRNSDPLIVFNSTPASIKGTSYQRISLISRSSGSWVSFGIIDAGGASSYVDPFIVVSSSNLIHLFWRISGGSNSYHRSFNTSNILGTVSSAFNVGTSIQHAICFSAGGSNRVIVTGSTGVAYFDSAATPTISTSSITNATIPTRAFYDQSDVYVIYRKAADEDLYGVKSTDYGANWGSEFSVYPNISITSVTTNLSYPSPNALLQGSNYVLSYLADADGSNYRYNEYVVRSAVSGISFAQIIS